MLSVFRIPVWLAGWNTFIFTHRMACQDLSSATINGYQGNSPLPIPNPESRRCSKGLLHSTLSPAWLNIISELAAETRNHLVSLS